MNAPIRNTPLTGSTLVENWKLRSLIRIACECRDPRWTDDQWVQDLADQIGLDLADPEGVMARRIA